VIEKCREQTTAKEQAATVEDLQRLHQLLSAATVISTTSQSQPKYLSKHNQLSTARLCRYVKERKENMIWLAVDSDGGDLQYQVSTTMTSK
jgi:hypothetical protein